MRLNSPQVRINGSFWPTYVTWKISESDFSFAGHIIRARDTQNRQESGLSEGKRCMLHWKPAPNDFQAWSIQGPHLAVVPSGNLRRINFFFCDFCCLKGMPQLAFVTEMVGFQTRAAKLENSGCNIHSLLVVGNLVISFHFQYQASIDCCILRYSLFAAI